LPELFTRPTWWNALLLVAGAILAPGKRTVTAALRILGREQETDFPIYHGVLNRAVWSSRAVAGWLLRLLVATFLDADATVVIGIDDTIERRWGHKISARGIYRDPVRSSKGHFVKPAPAKAGDQRPALACCPTARPHTLGRPHHGAAVSHHACPVQALLCRQATLAQDAAGLGPTGRPRLRRGRLLQIHRWLPGRRIVIVGDTAFAAIDFLAAVRTYVSVVTRLRLDANLYAPAPLGRRGRGRPPLKGKRLPKLSQVLLDANAIWQRHTVPLWYGAPIASSRSPPALPSGTTPA
jgi:hypothetical protein